MAKQKTLDTNQIDIKEIEELLEIQLKDRSSGENIIWATDTFKEIGVNFSPSAQITVESITRKYNEIIKPRIQKSREVQEFRSKDKADVFTPSWVCNVQNNLIDEVWFGCEKEKKNRKKIIKVTGTSSEKEKVSVISEPEPYDKLEGKKHETSVTRYERSQGNRKDCIAHYDYVCQVCGINFEQTYGEIGKDFIEVHHLYPVSQGKRQVNPIEDIIPLCSNCHYMIHCQENVSDWCGLKAIFLELKRNK